MLDLLVELMAVADGRCAYAEARPLARVEEDVSVRNGRVESVGLEESEGIGVRVRVGGGWGFAATRDVSRAGAEAALAPAIAIPEAPPAAPERPLAPVEPASGHWASTFAVDPFTVSLED